MKTFCRTIYCIALFSISHSLQAANPVLDEGYADPHMKAWDGKMYMSVGKDESPKHKTAHIIYWEIYSSEDMVHWTRECKIDPADSYLGPNYIKCWATDIAERNGKYYFYFSEGNTATGVFRADAPGGPYEDVLGKSMIPASLSENHEYDPTVFKDDDGEYYIIFGHDGHRGDHFYHYQIARLNEDMISLAEKPRDLINSNIYGFAGKKNKVADANYLHKRNGIYYLGRSAYETSTNIYGPYSNRRKLNQPGHLSIQDFNGQTYHAYSQRDMSHKSALFREIRMSYIHYRDNGDMVTDPFFLLKAKGYSTGVGNYDARWPTIEAEWFFALSGGEKREHPTKGFEIRGLKNGSTLHFPNVKNLKANHTITFNLSSIVDGAQIEIRRAGPEGELLGTCEVPNTGDWKTYQTVSCTLTNQAGEEDLCLVFKGNGDDLLHLDGFNFQTKQPKSLS